MRLNGRNTIFCVIIFPPMHKNGLINLTVPFSAQGYLRHKGFSLLFILVIILLISSCTEKSDTPSATTPPEGFSHSPISVDGDIKRLREIVSKGPADLNSRIELGNLLMDTGRFKEAIEVYGKILEITPENVDVRVDMGTCYRNSGDPERAAGEYRKALRYDPKNLYAHRNLGIVLAYNLGRTGEAIAEFEAYLALSPDASDTRQVKQAIRELKERS
ncbi:MAG TPA: tetratricopeptide repeat protein [Nitrospirae bacterium]|nr:tetratricopeptide repeat protein [Nitrospirota bacterium]